MNQIEIYSLAMTALLRQYEVATSIVRAKPCAETKAYRDHIVEKTMEVRRLMLAEHKRNLEEAEAAQLAHEAPQAPNLEQSETQQPEVHREQHRYETVIEYSYGHTTHTDYPNKEVATRAYNVLKDLMGKIPVIDRISMTDNGATIRSCERGDFL